MNHENAPVSGDFAAGAEFLHLCREGLLLALKAEGYLSEEQLDRALALLRGEPL